MNNQKHKFEELKGLTFNQLTILEELPNQIIYNKNRRIIECECVCGNIKSYELLKVLNNKVKTCGCRQSFRIGDKSGYLEILEYILDEKPLHSYTVKCNNCNSIKSYTASIFNVKKHCGCIPRDIIPRDIISLNTPFTKGVYTIIEELSNRRIKNKIRRMVKAICNICTHESILNYNKISNGKYGCIKCANTNASSAKRIYPQDVIRNLSSKRGAMIYRCYSEKSKDYMNYGGRGIKVCDEWRGKGSSKKFIEWSMINGYMKGLEIDRIDNDGDYSPQNCRYVTRKDNQRNKRMTVLDEQKVRDIKYGKYKGMSARQIFEAIGSCSESSVRSVLKNETWIDI